MGDPQVLFCVLLRARIWFSQVERSPLLHAIQVEEQTLVSFMTAQSGPSYR
ncbi:MAG TPA: hypothetical protein VFX67_00465 [Burkholderiales bacterium]|nr:hypothetical protein [Burkholderiales bacterium]